MTVTYTKVVAEGTVEVSDSKTGVTKLDKEPVTEIIKSSDKQYANIGFKGGVTKNMGEYNSVRVDVSLYLPVEVPTPPPGENPDETLKPEIDAAFEFARGWVDGKLNEIMSEIG